METIIDLSRKLGLLEKEVEPYGRVAAKISLDVIARLARKPEGKFIFVTALTPTYRGEGKTVTAISLSMALNRIGRTSIATLRQPSTGLYYAIKGGGSGGGRACLVPQDEIDIQCAWDSNAVTTAHNLAAAYVENDIFWGNHTGFDIEQVFWRRAIDLCDRALREVVVGAKSNKIRRKSGFIMTQASEMMAILSLSRDIDEMRDRISRIILGLDRKGSFVRMKDLAIEDELVRTLKKALLPNLVRTLEHTPVLLHTGPFSNISHGNSSVLADEIGMRLSDYVITEGGGGTDTGFEKFLGIKAPVLERLPDAVVMVVTARALKMHGLTSSNNGIVPEESEWSRENESALKLGAMNLQKHIQNVKLYGFPLVVAINEFSFDQEKEIRAIKKMALEMGADFAVSHLGWQKGSAGALELAEAAIQAAKRPYKYKRLYGDSLSTEEKIFEVATKIYGAEGINISSEAKRVLQKIKEQEPAGMDLCVAKTHLSLSHDSRLKNVPERYPLPIVDFIPFAGAGYICPVTERINLMPGMPKQPHGLSKNH